jgi:DNA-binding winged helix-turn-helix (wHTH) protein/tetratricopeptide (TPR) repeat protein
MAEIAVYEFGDFCLDPFEQVLLCHDKPVHLTQKAFALLLFLVERSGHLVEKSELMRQCWPDAFVEDANLAQTICMVRKVLGESRHSNRYVETVPRRGYRFVAPVSVRYKPTGTRTRLAVRAEKSLPSGDDQASTEPVAGLGYLGGNGFPVKQWPAKTYDERDEVHHRYIRGRYYWGKYTVDGLNQAIEYFRQVIKLDPDHSLAYTGLADCYYRLSNLHVLPRRAIPKAKAAVMTALKLDAGLAEAHALLALIRVFYDRDWTVAESEFQRAIELAPSSALPYERYGWALGMTGRLDEAIIQISRALYLEPRSAEICVSMGIILHLARRHDAAIAHAQMALDLQPEFFPACVLLGIAHLQQDRPAKAIAELQKAASLQSVPWTLGYLGYAYGVSGKREQTLQVLTELQNRSERSYVSQYALALVQAGLGDREQALLSLKRACEERNEMVGYIISSPELDELRPEHGFPAPGVAEPWQPLLRKVVGVAVPTY